MIRISYRILVLKNPKSFFLLFEKGESRGGGYRDPDLGERLAGRPGTPSHLPQTAPGHRRGSAAAAAAAAAQQQQQQHAVSHPHRHGQARQTQGIRFEP